MYKMDVQIVIIIEIIAELLSFLFIKVTSVREFFVSSLHIYKNIKLDWF